MGWQGWGEWGRTAVVHGHEPRVRFKVMLQLPKACLVNTATLPSGATALGGCSHGREPVAGVGVASFHAPPTNDHAVLSAMVSVVVSAAVLAAAQPTRPRAHRRITAVGAESASRRAGS